MLTLQGRVTDSGSNFTGTGQFKFALVTSTNANRTATAVANAPSGGYITGYTIIDHGSGYATAPAVTVFGGGGLGATAHATISGGMVSGISVDNTGDGNYTSAPMVTIAPPPPDISYTTYWSNDGTSVDGSEPAAAVNVSVTNGLFTVVLGDVTQPNMASIAAPVFQQSDLQLRIWFNDGVNGFAALEPAQNLTPAPYAVSAGMADRANSLRGLSIQDHNTNGAPDVVGGSPVNFAPSSIVGATVAGGGATNYPDLFGFLREFPNSVTADFGTVSGGAANASKGRYATVSGGFANTASGFWAMVGGGYANTASGYSTFVGGGGNNVASGDSATIPGGILNVASGAYSFAAGFQANATNDGAFVWADPQAAEFSSTTSNEFNIRAKNGIRIQSDKGIHLNAADGPLIVRDWAPFDANATGGKAGIGRWGLFMEPDYLTLGIPNVTGRYFQVAKYSTDGNYSTLLYVNQGGDLHATGNVYAKGVQLTSDRNAKAGFTRISPESVLAKVVALPITKWNYKTDAAEQKHIGPMAQDFHAAFGLNGADNKHISVVDEGGVALAAIQGLNEKLEAALQSRDEEIEQLKASVSQLKQLLSQQTSNKHEQTETNSK